MNKKLLALAVAASVYAPMVAMADPAGVTLYGRLNTELEIDSATDCKGAGCANQASRSRISSNSSMIGFKGKEEVSPGLYGIFQIESSVNVGGSVTPAVAAPQASPASGSIGTLASRNSNVGLTSDSYGTIFYGIWDTPYKSSTQPLDVFYADAGPYNYTAILGGNSTPSLDNTYNRRSFDRRQENSVEYWTPNFSGVSARLLYTTNSQRTSSAAPVSADPATYGFSVTYDKDGIFGTAAYERHFEYAASPKEKSNDYGIKLGLGYTYQDTSVSFIGEQLVYTGVLTNFGSGATGTYQASGLGYSDANGVANFPGAAGAATCASLAAVPGTPACSVAQTSNGPAFFTKTISTANLGNANEARVRSYYLGLKQKVGAGTIRAAYTFDQGVQLNNGGSAPLTRARAIILGYSYSLSKRTDVYAAFVQVNNDDNSKNDLGGGTQLGGIANGATVRSTGVGFRHTF